MAIPNEGTQNLPSDGLGQYFEALWNDNSGDNKFYAMRADNSTAKNLRVALYGADGNPLVLEQSDRLGTSMKRSQNATTGNYYTSLTFATSATSPAYTAVGYSLFGLIIPAGFLGTTLNFTVSHDNGSDYLPLYDSTGTVHVSMTVAASNAYDLPAELASWPYWKLVSNNSGETIAVYVVAKG